MTPKEGTRGRVLVVDDDVSCCSALRTLLRDEGYEVDVASGGEEALALIASAPPDVLLSDIRMPGMDGFALLRQARRTHDFPVLLMSADDKSEADVLAAGAAGYVGKPLDIDAVLRALDAALAARR